MKKGEERPKSEGRHVQRFVPVALFVALVGLTIVAYTRSLHAPLVFDDLNSIVPSKLKVYVSKFSLGFRSVANLSFGMNYFFSGMNLAAFRITNIILHILSAMMASFLTYRTLTLPSLRISPEVKERAVSIALFVAAFLLLHPIQTSAVNYITQRMAIMASLFSFAGFIFYIKGVTGKSMKSVFYYVLSSFCFVLAVFSKENAAMALLMLPVYDFFFLSSFQWREFRKRFVSLAALLISLAIIVGFRMGFGMNALGFIEQIAFFLSHPHQPMSSQAWMGFDLNWTPVEYLLTELRVVSRYILLIFVPLPSLMVFDYANTYPVSKGLFTPLATLLSLCFLSAVLVFSVRYCKKYPFVSFGILWYLVTISLESFIALGLDPYFEHRNYLPGFGLFFSISFIIASVMVQRVRIPKEAILLLLASLLFVLTFVRNGVWTEGRLLWEEAVRTSPNNVRARINLGTAYKGSGLIDRAIEQYRIALLIKPDEAGAHLNLGEAFLEKGWIDEAIGEFQTALRIESLSHAMKKAYDAHYNLGIAFFRKGLMDEAIQQYQKSLELKPDFAEAHVNLGIAYAARNSAEKAMEHFQTAVRFDPDLATARYNLGTALLNKGMVDEATEQYRIAVKLRPSYALAHIKLGITTMSLGLQEKAIEHFQTALRLKPNDTEALAGLGDAYLMGGKTDQAIEQFQLVLRLNPQSAAIHKKLGDAFFSKDQTDKAIEEYEVAVKLEPRDAVTHHKLGAALMKKGLDEKAIEQYQRAVQLNPQSALMQQGLGDLFAKKGLTDKAIQQYQAVLKLQPDNAVAHFNLGAIYTRQQLFEKAAFHLEEAVRISPDDQRFRMGLKAFHEYKAALKREEGKNREGALR